VAAGDPEDPGDSEKGVASSAGEASGRDGAEDGAEGAGAPVSTEAADAVLALAAAVEAKAEHPIGRAIVAEAKARGLRRERAKGFRALAGRGASATVGEREVAVVSARVVNERGLRLPPRLVHAARDAAALGKTVVYL